MANSVQGEWGSTAVDVNPAAPVEDLTQIKAHLASLSREFRNLISVLLTDLAFQGDTEMRFLGIRLNYNEVISHFPSGINFRFINLCDERVDARNDLQNGAPRPSPPPQQQANPHIQIQGSCTRTMGTGDQD